LLTPRGQCRDYTFCFDADNANLGVHPLHCHMQYHMVAGMFTTVNYVAADQIDSLIAAQNALIAADAQIAVYGQGSGSPRGAEAMVAMVVGMIAICVAGVWRLKW